MKSRLVIFYAMSFLFGNPGCWASGDTWSLSEFLKMVLSENLEIKSAKFANEAARSRASGFELQAPMLGLIQMTGEGVEFHGFEVTQNLPNPGRVYHAKQARRAEGQVAQAQSELVEREVLARATKAYLSFWSSSEELRLLRERRVILAEHLKLNRTRIRRDGPAQVHLLKTESDLDLLELDIEAAQREIQSSTVVLNQFLGREPDRGVGRVERPPLSALPNLSEAPVALVSRPSEWAVRVADARRSEARSRWLPDFVLRYKETSASSMLPKSREMMIGIELPFLLFGERQAATSAADAELRKASVDLKITELEAAGKFRVLWARAVSLKAQAELLQAKLLPRAHKRMTILQSTAPRDLESLIEHRETMESVNDLERQIVRVIVDHEAAVADLNSLSLNKDNL